MEVVHSNFNEVLPDIEAAIEKCTFLSIDCELTGLNATDNIINYFDTPKRYFEKNSKSCKDFLVIQYGICCFRYDDENDVFYQQAYNFYIFRRPFDRSSDERFLCQSSTMDFLIGHGFDFNKLFKEGIPYLNDAEERKYLDTLMEKRKAEKNENVIDVPNNAKKFIEDVIELVEGFIPSTDSEIELPKCNAFFRRLAYQTINEKFAKQVSLETRQIDKDRVLYATRVKSNAEIEKQAEEEYKAKVEKVLDFVGFSKVLKSIIQSEKLVVGHNMFLDIVHTVDKFLTPLPEDYEEFKECTHNLFPKLIDTKFMASHEKFKELIPNTVLKSVLDTVSIEPFKMPTVEIEKGREGYDLSSLKEHEAGFDAFITGLSFLSMWQYLSDSSSTNNKEIFSNLNALSPFMNKLFLMKLFDNQYIHFGGTEITPSRDHVFYLTFPSTWKTSNIMELFSPFGTVFIDWIDKTSAYIGLAKASNHTVVLNTLSQSDVYSICTYAERQLKEEKISSGKRRNDSITLLSSTSANKKPRTSDTIESEGFTKVKTRRQKKKAFSEDNEWE